MSKKTSKNTDSPTLGGSKNVETKVDTLLNIFLLGKLKKQGIKFQSDVYYLKKQCNTRKW